MEMRFPPRGRGGPGGGSFRGRGGGRGGVSIREQRVASAVGTCLNLLYLFYLLGHG